MMQGAASALAGYRRQFVYSLHRALTEPERSVQLEGREDLDVFDADERVIEHVQVKARTKALQLGDLLRRPGKDTGPGFLERMREALTADERVVGRLVSFGPLGRELEGAWLLDDAEARKSVRTKLLERDFDDEDLERLFTRVRLELVNEQLILDDTARMIDSLATGNTNVVFDLLLHWTYRLAEQRAMIRRGDLAARLDEIAKYLAEVGARARHWFTSIIPLDASRLEVALDDSTLRDEYRAGASARFEHILTNQDIRRDEMLQAIDDGFAHARVVCVRGASGQGKSSLAYRWLLDRSVTTFEVQRVDGPTRAREIALALGAYVRTTGLPVCVFHDVRPGDTNWTELLVELGNIRDIQLLITVREDDWNRSPKPASATSLHEVELKFDEDDARRLFDRLCAREPIRHFNSFDDAWGGFRRDGPLLEFVYMLTQTVTLERRLREQLHVLRAAGPSTAIDLLRWVAQADAYGARVDATRTADALALGPTERSFLIGSLEKEFLLRHDTERGQLLGLHPVRSEILTAIFDEIVSIAGQTWTDSAVGLLPLLIESDRSTFLLHAFSRRVEAREALKAALDRLPCATWQGAFGIVDALLWLGVAEYVQRNVALIDEVHASEGNTWHLVLAEDFVGLREFGYAGTPHLLEDPNLVKDESRRLRCRAWRERLTEPGSILELARCWLAQGTFPGPPQSAVEWTAAARTCFWIGHLGGEFGIDASWNVALARDLEELPIEVVADMYFSAWRIMTVDVFSSLRGPILERFEIEMDLVDLAEGDDAVSLHWLFIPRELLGEQHVENPSEQATAMLNEGSVRRCEVAYRLFPAHPRLDGHAVGHEFLELEYDPSVKAIPRENLLPKALVRFNGAFVRHASLRYRTNTWGEWTETILAQRLLAVEIIGAITRALESYFKAREVGDFQANKYLDLEQTLKMIQQFEHGIPFLFPRCAVDEWGFTSETVDRRQVSHDSDPDSVGMQALGLARYASVRSAFADHFRSSRNFLNQGFKVLQATPHVVNLRTEQQTVRDAFLREALGDPDLPRLSLLNLVDAHHGLAPTARGFAEHFGRHLDPARLRDCEERERKAFEQLVPLWREFIVHPHRVNRKRAKQQIIRDSDEAMRRMRIALRQRLAEYYDWRGAPNVQIHSRASTLVVVLDAKIGDVDVVAGWTRDALEDAFHGLREGFQGRDHATLREVVIVPTVGGRFDPDRVFGCAPESVAASQEDEPSIQGTRLEEAARVEIGLNPAEHDALTLARDLRFSAQQFRWGRGYWQECWQRGLEPDNVDSVPQIAVRLIRRCIALAQKMLDLARVVEGSLGSDYVQALMLPMNFEEAYADEDAVVTALREANDLINAGSLEDAWLVVLTLLSKIRESPTPKRSRSMEATKTRERERIMAMTPRERIELAWALGRRYAALHVAQRETKE